MVTWQIKEDPHCFAEGILLQLEKLLDVLSVDVD